MVLPQCKVDAEPAGIEAARRGGMRSIGVSRKGPLAAVLATLGGMCRTLRASLGMLLVAYGLLLAAAWYRFMTDPAMFQDTQPEEPVRLRSIRF